MFLLEQVYKQRVGPGGQTDFELVARDLEIGAGEKVAIVAPSGSGKTTLVDLLMFILRPSKCVSFEFRTADGCVTDIKKLWAFGRVGDLAELRKRHMGVVLQSGGLLRFASVKHNIELPRRLLGLPDDGTVHEVSRYLGIEHLLPKLPEQISVGERQRVAIARALVHQPEVIVADEPTASLDPANAHKVMKLLVEQVEATGATLVITSHDEQLLKKHGMRVINHKSAVIDKDATCSTFWT